MLISKYCFRNINKSKNEYKFSFEKYKIELNHKWFFDISFM